MIEGRYGKKRRLWETPLLFLTLRSLEAGIEKLLLDIIGSLSAFHFLIVLQSYQFPDMRVYSIFITGYPGMIAV